MPLKLCPGLVDGQLTPLQASLEAVRQVMRKSAEVRDYRKAVELQDLLYVAEKKELLTVEECAPPTPELCGEFFMQNGFVGTSEQSLPFVPMHPTSRPPQGTIALGSGTELVRAGAATAFAGLVAPSTGPSAGLVARG